MKTKITLNAIAAFLILCVTASCMKEKDLYEGGREPDGGGDTDAYTAYVYPFESEVQNATAEITIHTNKEIDFNAVSTAIPHLKHNKSLLIMLTQDDCKHSAYSWTWAAINGKPLSSIYYYDAAHFHSRDLPPNVYYLNNTLGSTDGAGNEVRFHFTTTLAPEWEWMNAESVVRKGYTENFYRFFMKSGLVWDNVKEIISYGNGIAFHDVDTEDIKNPATIQEHYKIAQDIILKELKGRGCKMLAEPNGNSTYIDAAQTYAPIQVITSQINATPIQPFNVTDDLEKTVVLRAFYETDLNLLKHEITSQRNASKEDRYAVYIAVHGTDTPWVETLEWLNDTYGKDGDDSVWFPSQEEYYEYNYYRIHGTTKVEKVDATTLKVTVNLPSKQYFYYPSVTVNLKGIPLVDIASISSNDVVTGFSYGSTAEGVMMNIDCRKHLYQHATHFVEQYESNKSVFSHKEDAIYFVNMLKNSPEKTALLKRLD